VSGRSRAFAVFAAVVCRLALAAPVDAEMGDRVDGLLGSYRSVTVAEWKALGPAAAPALEAAARDATALPSRRARALAALGVVQPAAAAPLVRQLAVDSRVPPLLRSAAVDAAPGVLGAETVGFLTPFLRDTDGVVRQRAAEALAGSGAAGCGAVVSEARTRSPSDPVAKAAAACAEQPRTGAAPAR
jgi:HEAT repeat protein